MSGLGIIAEQLPEVCDMCGKIDECRPYGPNGEDVCFDCATTKCNPEEIEKRMRGHIFGEK